MTASRNMTFVPGAAGAGSFWAPIIERLPTMWRLRALDLPGLGTVHSRADVASYGDLVDYVAGTITTPTALAAQSMGSFIALELALRYPHRLTHLVLVAATGGVEAAAHGAADWRAEYAAAYPQAEPWARASVPDLTERLGEIRIPTLLIWATADPLSPIGVAHFLASKLPAASLVSFTSSDHWFVHQFARETAAVIESFVSDPS